MGRSFPIFVLTLLALTAYGQAPSIGLIQFTSDNCADCRQVDDMLKRLQVRHAGALSIVVKQIPGPNTIEAKALGVDVLPTIFVNGRKLSGKIDESALVRVIDV